MKIHRVASGTQLLLCIGLLVMGSSARVAAESLGPISEETPPAACDVGEFVSDVRCTGGYCDNIEIGCQRLAGAILGRAVWMRWVSEEHGGRRQCPSNSLIAGFACRGGHCDNVSLYCVEVTNLSTPIYCREIGPISEEGGGRLSFFGAMMGDKAGQKFFASGIRCTGRYCDNKYFTVCEY